MVVLLAAIGGWGAASVYGAGRPSPTVSGTPERGGTSFVAKNQALLKTFLSRGDDTVSIPAVTFTQVGPNVKVNCPGKKGSCIVTADVHVQLTAPDQTNVALCPYLDGDGHAAQTTCDLNIGSSSGVLYQSHEYLHTYKVPHGTHTFQMKVWSSQASSSFGYSYVYNVYKNN